jgi:hypothetical protein
MTNTNLTMRVEPSTEQPIKEYAIQYVNEKLGIDVRLYRESKYI